MVTEVFIAVDRDEVYRATLPPGEYVIGRDEEAEIRIDHPTVSRRHARLIVEEEQVLLDDLGSGNGTTIEGNRVQMVSGLYEGQTARLGDVLLRARQKASPQTLPSSSQHYRKGDMVAAGGMGAIHEARQPAMGRKVAMKVMLREDGESGLRRFINEARITGMLEHPNIVPVHELGVDPDGHVFYTMKFVHGTTLAEVLAGLTTGHREAREKHPLSFLLTVFQKVCDAIAFAHSRGVHHRDLKPENIMIGDFGEVLVMDWGLSRETGFAGDAEDVLEGSVVDASGELRTMDGSVLGTPAYMSPEQARGEIAAIDERSDIYSLGVILHEILYLRTPVKSDSASEVVQKVAHGLLDPLPKRALRHLPGGKVPASLEAVRGKAMAFDPARRYQTVPDLQADIAAYQSGFATAAEGAGLGKHLALFVKRNRGVSVAVAAGLLTMAGLSVWFTTHLVRERDRAEALQAHAEEQLAYILKADEARQLAEQTALEVGEREEQERVGREEAELDAEQARISDAERARQLLEQERSMRMAAEQSADRSWRYLLDGSLAEAIKNIDIAVSLDRDNPEYVLRQADLLQSSGKFGAATAAYRRAIELGGGPRAADNVTLSIELERVQGGESGLKPQVVSRLTRALHEQGRGPEVLLVDAVREGRAVGGAGVEPTVGEGPTELWSLEKVLQPFTTQPGWNPSRLELLQDGTARVDLSGLDVSELPVLRGHQVSELDLSGTKVRHLGQLRGMSLRSLDLRDTDVRRLGALSGEPLEALYIDGAVGDLSPLAGLSLRVLHASGSRVEDLSPLAGMPLAEVRLDGTRVTDVGVLAALPLRRLHLDAAGVTDFEPLLALSDLEFVSLPAQAPPLDASRWPKLREIFHRGLDASGPMSAGTYRELAIQAAETRERIIRLLDDLGWEGFAPHRLTLGGVPETFDLDLRGIELADLRPLRQLPLHRLWIDRSAAELDLAPLLAHPTLRHLSLVGARVGDVSALARANLGLLSLAVSPGTLGVEAFAGHPSLQNLAYELGEDGRQPELTVDEFFATRENAPEALERRGVVAGFYFDDPQAGANGWEVRRRGVESAAAVWVADPKAAGGRGGGHLSITGEGNGGTAETFFHTPIQARRLQQNLYGGELAFRLRIEQDAVPDRPVEVILETGGRRYVHTATPPRPGEWQTYRVSLSAAGPWMVRDASGSRANFQALREAMGRVQSISIRACYNKDEGPWRADLDDFELRSSPTVVPGR